MTTNQKSVLAWFRSERIGAVLFEGQWMWPETIRKNPDIADRFLARGMTGGFEAEVIRGRAA